MIVWLVLIDAFSGPNEGGQRDFHEYVQIQTLHIGIVR